ncbi:MAG TPA: hypothetical protein DEO59_13910 [Balneola sp.]|nr:hypothetical protein [Balneola sp.]
MNNKEEQELRGNIRHLIKHVKTKRLEEEVLFRESLVEIAELELSKMLQEREVAGTDPTPNKSTGINVLEDLLKKIVPVLEVDYKSLTTNAEQRQSFRAHVINAIVSTLTPVEANNVAGDEEAELNEFDHSVSAYKSKSDSEYKEPSLDEEIDIEIGDEAGEDEDKFIDIRTDAEKKEEEEGEETDPREEFGLEDQDETGRNMAYASFKKIETSIIDSYELLSNPEDQELFYDYLIANAKLYFDKFEGELSPEVEEPTNQAYDMAKEEPGPEEAPVEDELEIEL